MGGLKNKVKEIRKLEKRYKLSKEYSIDYIESCDPVFFIDPDAAVGKIKTRRAGYYADIGYACSHPGCNIVGDRYIVGIDNGGGIHLDLYGLDSEGELNMITIDHIKPRSIGGPDHISNYQPMCMLHNSQKNNEWSDEDKKKYYERGGV